MKPARQCRRVLSSTVIKLFKSLMCYMDDIREQFTEYESNVMSRLPDPDYSDANWHVRKRSTQIRFFDSPALDTAMDARSTFRVSTFLPIVHSLKTELVRRGKAYMEIHECFGFLVDRNLQKDLIQERSSCWRASLRTFTISSLLSFACW